LAILPHFGHGEGLPNLTSNKYDKIESSVGKVLSTVDQLVPSKFGCDQGFRHCGFSHGRPIGYPSLAMYGRLLIIDLRLANRAATGLIAIHLLEFNAGRCDFDPFRCSPAELAGAF